MNLPKGAPFMEEGLQLNPADLADMLTNLSAGGFSGYVQMDLPEARKGYVFLARGQTIRAFQAGAEGAKLYTCERLFAQAGEQGVPCASYVLSEEMATLLAYSFALESGSDWKAPFQGEKRTGYAFFDEGAVLFSNGQPIQEPLAQCYGQIVCGREAVSKLLQEGRATQVYSLPLNQLEQTAKRLHQDLDKMTEVTLKSVSGFFATKDSLKIDSELAQDWAVKGTFQLVVEGLDGRPIGTMQAKVGGKKPQVLEIPVKIMQEWGLSEEQPVMIYPQNEA